MTSEQEALNILFYLGKMKGFKISFFDGIGYVSIKDHHVDIWERFHHQKDFPAAMRRLKAKWEAKQQGKETNQ